MTVNLRVFKGIIFLILATLACVICSRWQLATIIMLYALIYCAYPLIIRYFVEFKKTKFFKMRVKESIPSSISGKTIVKESNRFAYKAMTFKGREVEGTVLANDRMDACAKVRELGYFPIVIEIDM